MNNNHKFFLGFTPVSPPEEGIVGIDPEHLVEKLTTKTNIKLNSAFFIKLYSGL